MLSTSPVLAPTPTWLAPLVSVLRKLVVKRPTQAGRTAYSHLAASLLLVYPTRAPILLFKNDSVAEEDTKPFSYLFISLLLIDIRSSFSSLLEELNDSNYPATSDRLAAAFDIISCFIGFLVKLLDQDTTISTFSMPPDLLLKLRKTIAETMSLTIEYLRARWDASVAGASGLHPSARTGTAATSEGTRLTITWESKKDSVNTDLLVLASIKTLAMWIREDENENLRNECAGIMDLLIELYKSTIPKTLDFRYPILLALEVILVTDDGVDAFLEQDGWQILMVDLEAILQRTANDSSFDKADEAARGLALVSVLLAVVDHPSTSSPREDWMSVVKVTTGMKSVSRSSLSVVTEFQIAMLQLSAALLSKAADGMQKRYITSIPALSGLAKQLTNVTMEIDNEVERDEYAIQVLPISNGMSNANILLLGYRIWREMSC
jgi:hypothetical protein